MLGTKTWIVLSSDVAVTDLITKRSATYSSRLDMYIGQTLCSGGFRFLMMQYGPQWRMYRKMIHNLLSVTVSRAYVPYQMLENKQMLHEMLQQPDAILENVRRYSNSLTTSFLYGWRSPTSDNPDVKQLFGGFEVFGQLNQTPEAILLDCFPILRQIPDALMPIKAKARLHHRTEKPLYRRHWMNAKNSFEEGTARPCFSVNAAKTQKIENFSDDQAAYICGTILEAGSDTTSNTLYAFIQAMVVFPDAQKRAQEEIERVVGEDRLPTMDDEPNLPYIRACIKETLRWMPTTPTGGVPHSNTEEDNYMGYIIPQGAGLLINTWGIHMDPKRYPEPRRFNPERFIGFNQSAADSANQPDPAKRDHFAFGAGRRICPGMHVAERSLFIGMSRLLWAFDFSPKLDASGNAIMPDIENLTQGFVIRPEKYEATIKPRSKKRAELVEMEWKMAQKQSLNPVDKQWEVIPEGMAMSL